MKTDEREVVNQQQSPLICDGVKLKQTRKKTRVITESKNKQETL